MAWEVHIYNCYLKAAIALPEGEKYYVNKKIKVRIPYNTETGLYDLRLNTPFLFAPKEVIMNNPEKINVIKGRNARGKDNS